MNDQSPKRNEAGRPAVAQPLGNASSANPDSANPASANPASAQQRRQLLRAVGASGALAGIGLPFSAQATGRPYCTRNSNNYHATASAVGSIIGSITGSTPPIAGHRCAHYQNASNWGGGYSNGRSSALSYNACANASASASIKLRFWQVFELTNPGSGQKYRYCEDLINTDSSSIEAHWLTAMFNANKRVPFAYTPTQVIDLYNGVNPLMGGTATPGLNANALILFRDYLSSMV